LLQQVYTRMGLLGAAPHCTLQLTQPVHPAVGCQTVCVSPCMTLCEQYSTLCVRACRIGYLEQEPQLDAGETVAENIAPAVKHIK